LRRLGDLGPDALPYLLNPRASLPSVNRAGIEGLCRVGSQGRAVAEPILLAMWAKPDHLSYDERSTMFVSMRRMGISPPPLIDDKRKFFAQLQTEWDDVSPSSPIAGMRNPRRAAGSGTQSARACVAKLTSRGQRIWLSALGFPCNLAVRLCRATRSRFVLAGSHKISCGTCAMPASVREHRRPPGAKRPPMARHATYHHSLRQSHAWPTTGHQQS
jgi:hypothetical protein